MGNENAGDLADFQVTPQNLMLGSFTTVKQPQLFERQTQGQRWIARSPELVPKVICTSQTLQN